MSEKSVGEDGMVQQYDDDFGTRKMSIVPIIVGSGRRGSSTSRSSVTLIKTSNNTVTVDSGSQDQEQEIRDRMGQISIPLEKVNVLVTTRANSNFNGNDRIFVNALQHIREEEWGGTLGAVRKVMIGTPYHWIDRYLKLVRLPFPAPGTLVLLVHLPSREELLDPDTKHLAGKIVGIVGYALDSGENPQVRSIMDAFRKEDEEGVARERVTSIKSLKDLMIYCDYIIPGHGEMFSTRDQ